MSTADAAWLYARAIKAAIQAAESAGVDVYIDTDNASITVNIPGLNLEIDKHYVSNGGDNAWRIYKYGDDNLAVALQEQIDRTIPKGLSGQ